MILQVNSDREDAEAQWAGVQQHGVVMGVKELLIQCRHAPVNRRLQHHSPHHIVAQCDGGC